MDDNIQNQIKQIRADQACFILGTVPLELTGELDWIIKPESYIAKMSNMTLPLGIPPDVLHPLQRPPSDYLRKQRKRILRYCREISIAVTDLDFSQSNNISDELPLDCSE